MDQNPHVGAILLMGLPGAGKGTQAFRLAERFPNFVHFDTGGEIYRRITDPHFADDPLIREQERIYFAGDLNTPEWVAGLVSERIRFYSSKSQGVIFSGSPRTLKEAQTIFPLLEEGYGRNRTLVLEVLTSLETVIARSRKRITCANDACRYPAHWEERGEPCPNCGQPLPTEIPKKERWKIEKLEDGTRVREFEERTRPAIEFLKERVAYARVDGEKSEDKVFAQILTAVKKNLG